MDSRLHQNRVQLIPSGTPRERDRQETVVPRLKSSPERCLPVYFRGPGVPYIPGTAWPTRSSLEYQVPAALRGSFRGQSNRCRLVLAGPTGARFGRCPLANGPCVHRHNALDIYSVKKELSFESKMNIYSIAPLTNKIDADAQVSSEQLIQGLASGVLGYWGPVILPYRTHRGPPTHRGIIDPP